MNGLAPVQVQFKIEPKLIPATNLIRYGEFPMGVGGFGDVWQCSMVTQSGTQRLVAVKSFRVFSATDAKALEAIGKRLSREAYVWIQLEHDHILPLEGVTVAGAFGPLPALVSLWMEEGSLNDYLNQKFFGLSDTQKRELIRQVTAGISYLHGKGIVHGDLTPTNILVDRSGHLRIADFGLSIILAEADYDTFNSSYPGNVRWMPPEALRDEDEDEDEDQDEDEGEDKDKKPTKAWDIYSYGCVVLQIFSGNQPYMWIKNGLAVIRAMERGHLPFKLDIQSYRVYRQFLPCLNRISADRPTMDDIISVPAFPRIGQTSSSSLSSL
jgi:serine/threonine protein kinase